ncbi:gamma-glutamyltransferase [Promicromonospora soli]
MAVLATAAIATALSACTATPPQPRQSQGETASPSPSASAPEPEPALGGYGVSAGHPLAAQAGEQMLERGGTAVDAAIAAAFADAVMQPASSGIGGGGASIVVADGSAQNYEYREVVNQAGQVPEGGAGIPGFVAGMERLHRDHGNLPWADLLAPAIQIADSGGPVSRYLASSINSSYGQDITGSLPQFQRADGTPLREGDLLVQKDLAETMSNLAEEGPDSFYTGTLAQIVGKTPGIDKKSLAAYEVDVFEPAAGPVGDYTMLSGAPALPGAAIIQMVQIAEAAGIADVDPGSPEFVDLLSRAWQVADASVQEYFGDPRFVDVPVDRLTDPEQNAQIAATLPDAAETTSRSAALGGYESAPNTTHISVVDANGVAVSMTNTITNYWGNGQYVAGFFLNDQLERFDDVGRTDANRPEPGRRSVTWSLAVHAARHTAAAGTRDRHPRRPPDPQHHRERHHPLGAARPGAGDRGPRGPVHPDRRRAAPGEAGPRRCDACAGLRRRRGRRGVPGQLRLRPGPRDQLGDRRGAQLRRHTAVGWFRGRQDGRLTRGSEATGAAPPGGAAR